MSLKTLVVGVAAVCLSFSVSFAQEAGPSGERLCLNPKEVPDDSDSKFVATQFPAWSKVSPRIRPLLEAYLAKLFNGQGDAESAYKAWLAKYNEQGSSLFATLHTLASIRISYGAGQDDDALSMIVAIDAVKGDRIRAVLDPSRFEAWRSSGGRYATRNGGKDEAGEVKFNGHTTMGGSIHCGYDIQGYTKRGNPPSVQWNYRFKDSMADIDMDGHKPNWVGIPNPKHYSYRNSDVRFWFDKYLKKYGTPGFQVEKRKEKAYQRP
ncbi:MAG TPA: hypothetical protein VFV50_06420 [Bdellovibrionales bacterium]|nr:hypothetical protein [Bdellovibrionales bacterium]